MMHEQNENINRYRDYKKNQTEILDLKNTITEQNGWLVGSCCIAQGDLLGTL